VLVYIERKIQLNARLCLQQEPFKESVGWEAIPVGRLDGEVPK
jgi:hypothetical protein